MPYAKRKEDWVNTTDYIDESDVDAWETAIYELKTSGAGIDIRDYEASTDSSDNTAAVQAALDAVDAGGTGVILIPPGTWKFEGTLTIPRGRTVILRGCGRENTKLQWMTDLGSGEYAIKMASGFPNQERIHIEQLSVVCQPGVGSGATYGDIPADMYGIDVTNGVWVQNVLVSHFYAGFVIGGNHSAIRDSTSLRCYYGIYYINGTTIGNHTFDTLILYGNFACIGLETGTAISGESFNQVHFIDSPYAIYRETGALGGGDTNAFIVGTSFTGCSFESIGNGVIYDEDMDGTVVDSTLIGCASATPFYAGTQIAGRDADYAVRAGSWSNMVVNSNADLFVPGDLGIFEVDSMVNFEWRYLSNSIGDLSATVSPVVGTDPVNTVWHAGPGKCVVVRTAAACNKDDLLVAAVFGTVTKATSGAPVGVATHAAGANDTVVMCIENPGTYGNMKINTSDTGFDSGDWVKQDSVNAGQVVTATGPLDGVPVGIAVNGDVGGKVDVWLRGLH